MRASSSHQIPSAVRLAGNRYPPTHPAQPGRNWAARFQNVLLGEDGVRLLPGSVRYAWPSELDLMARLAGLALRERWGGWRREPYTGSTTGLYVAVYEHAGAAAS